MSCASPLHVLVLAGNRCGHTDSVLRKVLNRHNDFVLTDARASDLGVPEFDGLPGKKFAAVVIAGRCDAKLTAGQESGLISYVENGGGLVVLHDGAVSFPGNPKIAAMVGACIAAGPSQEVESIVEINAALRSAGQAMARGMDDFLVRDVPCPMTVVNEAEVFATIRWSNKPHAAGYLLKRGKGRVVGLAAGRSAAALQQPAMGAWLRRAVRVAAGATFSGQINVGIIGYGGAFNMGKHHSELLAAQPGFKTVAVCDVDPKRTEQAKTELGAHIRTYNQMDQIMADGEVNLVVVILPHNLHAAACIAASKAGKHVVTEKPFCLTIAEADEMIAAASAANKMLTVFHNRRWNPDFLQILKTVRSGEIGDVFHVEAATAGYGRPGPWWRSDKSISGGILYDWGAHYADWMFNIVNQRVESVSGVLHKRYWHNSTNEDFAQVYIRFEGGVSAILEQGSLAAIKRPGWRILGTRGGITNAGPGAEVIVNTYHQDVLRETKIPTPKERNNFYANVGNHLFVGEPLLVTPQQARRTIALFELAEKSHAQGGKPLAIPGEENFVSDYQTPA
jgi:predicted dehydrogenase/type 1 glutamine amidotransferase